MKTFQLLIFFCAVICIVFNPFSIFFQRQIILFTAAHFKLKRLANAKWLKRELCSQSCRHAVSRSVNIYEQTFFPPRACMYYCGRILYFSFKILSALFVIFIITFYILNFIFPFQFAAAVLYSKQLIGYIAWPALYNFIGSYSAEIHNF